MDVNSVANTYEPPIMTASPIPVTGAGAGTPAADAMQKTPHENASSAGSADNIAVAEAIKSPAEIEKEKQAAAQKPTKDVVEKTVEEINKAISTYNREMRISVHEKTRQIMVKVMDTQEKKVIRELPPERVLDAFARTLELAGIIIDKKS